MNTLSWLLYLADVAGTVDNASSFLSFFCFVCFVASIIAVCLAEENSGKDSFLYQFIKGWPTRTFIAFFVFIGLTFVTPSKTTMYLIIASEMGEELIETEEIAAIRTFVVEYLESQNIEIPVK